MRSFRFLVIFLVFSVVTSAQSKKEWTSLFNGRNFNGWNQISGEMAPQIVMG